MGEFNSMAVDLKLRHQEPRDDQLIDFERQTESTGVIYQTFVKRGFDLIGAVTLLLVLSIPMLFISLLVKASSSGPVLFRQTRFGRDSKPFTLFKFRSMTTSAPQKSNKDFEPKEMTAYITPVGRILRKTSLDELPQLFNILRNEMSFVGPRPLASTDEFVVRSRRQNGADRVRPGITGLAQVRGRNLLTDNCKAKLDASYANRCSFSLDFLILCKTALVVILQRGIDQHSR